jgi:SAM-dependent methyltransferase
MKLVTDVMGSSTRALLAKVAVPPGAACLDVGCGGGDVTFDLANLVGPRGRVLGVDIDATQIEQARREAHERNLQNVQFATCDVTKWQPDEPFDVIYLRFLLTHLRDPSALLASLSGHLRAGGVMIVEDIDYRGHFAEPACRALDRSVDLYVRAARNRGGDPYIGPRLPALLRATGLQNVQMDLVHHAALAGGIKLLLCVTLENIAEVVLQDRLATEDELRRDIEELYAFARNPHTILGGPRIFQVWGRKDYALGPR